LIEIDTELLANCFALTVSDHIRSGKKVSNRIDNLVYRIDLRDYNSLRNYLSRYENHEKYLTGYEIVLDQWILNQKDNTITPDSLFKKAFQLNQGDIFHTFLTIYTSLYRNARWYKDMVNYKSSWIRMQSYFNKFVDIRGDLEEREGSQNTGDHIGTWYRIWGVMALYFYATGRDFRDQTDFAFLSGELLELEWAMTYEFTYFHAWIAEKIKPYMKYAFWNNGNTWTNYDKRIEVYNFVALDIASDFFGNLTGFSHIDLNSYREECKDNDYFDLK
jgi:hypothetical protein